LLPSNGNLDIFANQGLPKVWLLDLLQHVQAMWKPADVKEQRLKARPVSSTWRNTDTRRLIASSDLVPSLP
jgi:hypothetical protein